MSIELLAFIALAIFVYWISSGSNASFSATIKIAKLIGNTIFFFDKPIQDYRRKHEALADSDALPIEQREHHRRIANRVKNALSVIYGTLIAAAVIAFFGLLFYGRLHRLWFGAQVPL